LDINAQWFNEEVVDAYDGLAGDDTFMEPKFTTLLRTRIASIIDKLNRRDYPYANFLIHRGLSQELPDILPGARIDWLDVAVEDNTQYQVHGGPLKA